MSCGCARGHCEAATAEQCQQIQASALELERCLHSDYSDLFAADAVRSGREKLTC